MSDGDRLRQSWHNALNEAEAHFRRLLTSSSSSDWKRVPNSPGSSSSVKGKLRGVTIPELSDVVTHKKTSKSGDDIYRIGLDVFTGDEPVSLEPWKAVLATPELRQEWDPAVEDAHLVELFDHKTRICKTNFSLGWPANPRDVVTISRSFHDASTILDISTSLPRSPDEPAYLRPSPPYVRSHVTLFAWCVQYVQPQQRSPQAATEQPNKKNSLGGRLRITCFWQHDLRALWGFGSSSGISQQLCTMMLGLLKTVKKRGSQVPMLSGYGNGVTIERIRFQIDREALTIDYSIIPEEDTPPSVETTQGVDELHAIRENRRLTRSVECVLPSSGGWDVRLTTKASSQQVEQLPWFADATRSRSSFSPTPLPKEFDPIIFKITHSPLLDDHSILKVRVVIETSGPSSRLRLNGIPQPIQDIEERDPSSSLISHQILHDVASNADLSFHTASSMNTLNSIGSTSSMSPTLVRSSTLAERAPAAEKSVLSRVRRNYIYFSSLLQEPEAKWKRTTESRGVSVTQLDSIDPTLVVYRAEATFVGVGLWDLYGALVSPGAKMYWDKQHENAVLLEDVNELSELWHFKTRPAWPVNGRDAIVLKTVYKSPTTIHVFSFSADDSHLFPNIPPVEPNVIRIQVDLQGWAIEALSPTTTLLTLLEQSDPKGWTNKTSIPQQMVNHVAGVGDFVIKCGGPPVVSRLAGAKANQLRYDHERGSFKIEYEGSAARRASIPNSDNVNNGIGSGVLSTIECELRCDIDTWATSLDIVVDPPPQSISCLRRHRLSAEGGGLWISMSHDALFVDDERLLAIVRRGPLGLGKEKGVVVVNGARVNVDIEELLEHEIKSLTKRKRVKPPRIPLDQPPVMGVIRRRRAEWDADAEANVASISEGETAVAGTISVWAKAPNLSSPLTRFFTNAMEQATTTTQQAVAAIAPAAVAAEDIVLSSSTLPMQYALQALAWTQEYHAISDWSLVSDKGLSVHRKLTPELSSVIPVHKGEKVIEGVSADELACFVTEPSCRKLWDDRFDSASVLESFGADCRTSFVVLRAGFPFRDRGFYVASMKARAPVVVPHRNNGDAEQSNGTHNAIFCVSASFSPESVASFSSAKYNPQTLPVGRVFVDAWVLETLDPYTTENYAIPSTRCTRLVAVDFAGSIPAAVNSLINATLAKSILAVEVHMKNISPLPITRLPLSGLLVTDKKADEIATTGASWKLRNRDDNRVLVMTNYFPDERIYHSTLLLKLPSPTPWSPELATPTPSKIITSPRFPETSQPPVTSSPSPPLLNSLPRTSSPSPNLSRERLRSSSSAFTLKGEVRPSTDLLVAEIVVDSKLYPDGYDVHLRSRIRDGKKRIPLQPPVSDSQAHRVLPIAHTVHTMPSSPLHSLGLNADRPTRHLLRFSLPTAQYQISTVQDPLTGETQTAPPKPQWLLDLQEKGAVVEFEIRPATPGSKRGKKLVMVDGFVSVILNEKESLTSLGRDELQEDRVSKMPVLSRTLNDAEVIPLELQNPLAVAENLLNPSETSLLTVAGHDANGMDQGSSCEESSCATLDAPIVPAPVTDAPQVASSGLLGFLHSYPNPLLRFTSAPPRTTTPPSKPSSEPPSRRDSGTHNELPGGFKDPDNGPISTCSTTSLYPLSTIIVVGLIAFLIGSLLRSLLSPADFIYVVTDLQESEEGSTGWREIKRLLEIKYIMGGWDFQIAVVRRH